MFIEALKSFFLGVVQGITEWLPISSTGHMILLNEFLKMKFSEDFVNLFFVVIQFGSILAVLVLFWDRLYPFQKSLGPHEKGDIYSLWMKIIVTMIPTGIAGFLFEDAIDRIFYKPIPIAAALIVYGLVFIFLNQDSKNARIKSVSQISYKTALFLGLFQTLALIPGTSRSGSTIIGALLLGLSRGAAAEFSFFMAIPVMAGASLYKIAKFGFSFTGGELLILIIGLLTAFIVSLFVIQFLLSYIRKHSFKAFGYYRVLLGILVILYFTLFR